jgi:hypothetical protein
MVLLLGYLPAPLHVSEPIKAGDDCLVVGGTNGKNLNRKVRVVSLQGEHSKLGRIWRCAAPNLMQFDGSYNDWADFAASWLQKIDGVKPVQTQTDELTV